MCTQSGGEAPEHIVVPEAYVSDDLDHGPGLLFDPGLTIVGVGMKMMLGYAESLRFLGGIAAAAPRMDGVALFVLPSFPVLPMARELLTGTGIAWGAQDGHWEDAGAHTGSVSAAMLAELGCALMEIGHAERRRDFAEDDAMVARKAAAASRSGLLPLICVGEREVRSDARDIVRRQVLAALGGLPEDAPAVVAYEPVWAIGAAYPAGVDHVEAMVAAIRATVADRAGPVRILYGGGVTEEQATALLATGADGIFASRSLLDLSRLERVVDAVAGAS